MSEGTSSSSPRRYPLNSIPFEAFHDGSWHGIHFIRIQDGRLYAKINYPEKTILNIQTKQIRMKSRKATGSDCINFLKKGIDVCVLLSNKTTSDSNSNIASWVDARIIDVQKHHPRIDQCECMFLIIPYSSKGHINKRKQLSSKETKSLKLNHISILQNIIIEPDQNGKFVANCTENNSSIYKTKLIGDFATELASLIVLSSLYGRNFEIKMIQNKIIHHIINSNFSDASSSMNMKIICFKDFNGVHKPTVETITNVEEKNDFDEKNGEDLVVLANDNSFEEINLRRSKRDHKSQPDIFSSYSPQPNFGRFYPPPSAKNNYSKNSTVKGKMVNDTTEVRNKKEPFEIENKNGEEAFEFENKKRKEIIRLDKKERNETLGVEYKKRKRGMSKKQRDEVIEELIEEIKRYTGNNAKFDGDKEEKVVCEWSASSYPETKEHFIWSPPNSDSEYEIEKDENEDIYEMYDLCLIEDAIEKKKNLNCDVHEESTETEDSCAHDDCELDEQFGMICKSCHVVITDIQDIFPRMKGGQKFSPEKTNPITDNPLHIDPQTFANFPSEISRAKTYKDIWSSIPNLEPKLHHHQRNAIEFIWKNLAGTTNLEKINPLNKNKGGCVISHTPGSGKTLTVISFLTSYLANYHNVHPLILTPKSAVHTWENEFKKWDTKIDVYIMHSKPSKKRSRIMDSLQMIKLWHQKPGVLLMTYPLFFSLARENAKDDYSKCMANVLINNPSLLILDEGHNPRNTKSKLRKLLMKVKTDMRILLSGTVYQNNFTEYCNTLCLARPRFVRDLINEFDRKKGVGKIRKGKKKLKSEEKARKLFVEKIGEKIESEKENDRKQGINLLTKLTSKFIDTFDGQNLENLPGLETYTIFLKSTEPQKRILNKLQNSKKPQSRYLLETELLVSLGSIHPSLVTKSKCSKAFFTERELKEIEKHEENSSIGSKTRFVMDVMIESLLKEEKEKVLIFCHNLAPLNLLVKLFETNFDWKLGEQILILSGEQDLAVRSNSIDKFNGDKQGNIKVLLASTNACAEGINLTAASRLVLLDSEWNHSKTRQAIARAFRIGQEKTVYVYLLLGTEKWETDKYESNMRKAWMSKMVVSGTSLERERRVEVEGPEIGDELLREVVSKDGKQIIEKVVLHE